MSYLQEATRHRDYAPTQFDHHIVLDDQEDWLVAPVSITRDTQCSVTLSNWAAIQEDLEREGIDYDIHRFGHWGPGWFEIILIEPTEKAAEWLYDTKGALADYPVLDESKMSEIESEQEMDAWDGWLYRDFEDALEDRLDITLEDDISYEAFNDWRELACVDWNHGNDGAGINIESIIDSISIDDLESAGIEFTHNTPQGDVWELLSFDGHLIYWSESWDAMREWSLSGQTIVAAPYDAQRHDYEIERTPSVVCCYG